MIIEEKTMLSMNSSQELWTLLGGREEYEQVVDVNEDENFEMLINDSNMVYRVLALDTEYILEPVVEAWGSILSYNILNEEEVFVFDFGSEVYVWNGRNSTNDIKKYGMLLAKQLFESGYDYTKCVLTPLKSQYSQVTEEELDSKYIKSIEGRPSWAILGRVSQNVETILFKGKFPDWPSESTTPSLKKLSYSKSNEFYKKTKKNSSPINRNTIAVLKYDYIDPKVLLSKAIYEENPVNLVLESTNIGRGRNWYDVIERRGYNVLTDRVQVWKISNNELIDCDNKKFGEFYRNETYTILWKYKLVPTGFKTLKGGMSQYQVTTGRDRQALFFWHGKHSKRNDKGALTLLTMGLGDKTLNSMPHVLVFEEKEIAAFCQLFNGSMIVFDNNKEIDVDEWKMFLIRGAEIEEENHLVEVKLSLENLRSMTSVLIVNSERIIIWNGCKSSEIYRKKIRLCAEKLIKNHQTTFNFTEKLAIEEVEEGGEKESLKNIFFSRLGQDLGSRHCYYNSLVSVKQNQNDAFTPRLFQMVTLYGKFEAKEILNPLRSDNTCAFPFCQFHLYEEKQPALFLFDINETLYIWQGWSDNIQASVDDKDIMTEMNSDITATVSTKIRFNHSRKYALETAINYWNTKYSNNKPFNGYIVYAGLEPIEFINLFPYWETNEHAKICNLNVSFKNSLIFCYLIKITN
jgi:supervillin